MKKETAELLELIPAFFWLFVFVGIVWLWSRFGRGEKTALTIKELLKIKEKCADYEPEKIAERLFKEILESVREKFGEKFEEEFGEEIDKRLAEAVRKVVESSLGFGDLRKDSNLRKCIEGHLKIIVTRGNRQSIENYLADLEKNIVKIRDEAVELFGAIALRLQYRKGAFNENEVNLCCHLFEFIDEFQLIIGYFANPYRYGSEACAVQIFDIPYREKEKFFKVCRNAEISKQALMSHPYIRQSPLTEFFHTPLPMPIPFAKRFEHSHILGGTGHGKTQLLLALIYNDLLKAREGKGGLCVIDSQGDLIETLSHLSLFDPEVENSLADKLVLVDPNDVEYPICLNVFDVGLGRLGQMPAYQREMTFNFAVSLYDYIFSDLVEGKLTMYQTNIFQFCAKLLLNIKGVTLLDFIELLEGKGDYSKELAGADETTQRFFEKEFSSTVYEQTKKQISARLWSVIRNDTFRKMLVNQENKVDMFEAMNQGKIVLINTSKMLLQSEGAKMLGKFFIALILQNMLLRASIPEEKRRPFFVYVDEAQDYMTDTLGEFLTQARKYKVGVILAHQYLKQLDAVSSNLRHSTLANTSIKLVGKVDLADAREMGGRIGVDRDDILGLKKKDREFTEFFCYVKDAIPRAVKTRVPLGVVNQKPRMTDENYNLLIEMNRNKFSTSSLSPTPQEPVARVEGDNVFQLGERKKL